MTAVDELPPITPTGDDAADDELYLLRTATQAIDERAQEVNDLAAERRRLVLSLRQRGIPFRTIADAIPTSENTIYKIHREAKAARQRGELT